MHKIYAPYASVQWDNDQGAYVMVVVPRDCEVQCDYISATATVLAALSNTCLRVLD
jgi:hypothetical protein